MTVPLRCQGGLFVNAFLQVRLKAVDRETASVVFWDVSLKLWLFSVMLKKLAVHSHLLNVVNPSAREVTSHLRYCQNMSGWQVASKTTVNSWAKNETYIKQNWEQRQRERNDVVGSSNKVISYWKRHAVVVFLVMTLIHSNFKSCRSLNVFSRKLS